MKKIFKTLAVITCLLLLACTSDDYQNSTTSNNLKSKNVTNSYRQIETFLHSNTFERHKEFIKTFGEVDSEKGITRSLEEHGAEGEVIIIPITTTEGVVVGVLEAVDLKYEGFLPHGDTYAVNLVDYGNFDLELKSGIVKLFDLNYGHSLHSELTIDNNIITDWETIPVIYDNGEDLKPANGLYELCDSNGNGNISLSECYSCGKNSLAGSGTFGEWLCDIPGLGWLGCWSTLTAACAVISSIY